MCFGCFLQWKEDAEWLPQLQSLAKELATQQDPAAVVLQVLYSDALTPANNADIDAATAPVIDQYSVETILVAIISLLYRYRPAPLVHQRSTALFDRFYSLQPPKDEVLAKCYLAQSILLAMSNSFAYTRADAKTPVPDPKERTVQVL